MGALFSRDAHPVDAFHEVSLEHEVHEQDGQDAEHRTGHADGLVQSGGAAGLRLGVAVEIGGEFLQLYHQCSPLGLGHNAGHIHPGQVGIVPVPHKGEQEHGQNGGSSRRQRNPYKGLEIPRAVNLGRLNQYLGYLLEKLVENQDKAGGVDSRIEKRDSAESSRPCGRRSVHCPSDCQRI